MSGSWMIPVAFTMGMLCSCAEDTINARQKDGTPRHPGAPTTDIYGEDEGMRSQTLEGNTH